VTSQITETEQKITCEEPRHRGRKTTRQLRHNLSLKPLNRLKLAIFSDVCNDLKKYEYVTQKRDV
jgi:hypothetical protein